MSKKKGPRIIITLECQKCRTSSDPKRSNGVSRYVTTKNRKNTTNKLNLRKHCRYSNLSTYHKETK